MTGDELTLTLTIAGDELTLALAKGVTGEERSQQAVRALWAAQVALRVAVRGLCGSALSGARALGGSRRLRAQGSGLWAARGSGRLGAHNR